MKAALFMRFVLALVTFLSSVQGYKLCNLSDSVCMTNGANTVYKAIVEGSGEPIDPLHIVKISGKTKNQNYQFSNITLRGFGNCEVSNLIVNKEKSMFEHHLRCPELNFNFNYEVDGAVDTFVIDGKSSAKLTATDYEIITKGKYEVKITKKDEPHFYISKFGIKINAGKIIFASDKLETANCDNKTEIFSTMINENSTINKDYLQTVLITKFMTMLIDRFNTELSILSPSEAFPQKEK